MNNIIYELQIWTEYDLLTGEPGQHGLDEKTQIQALDNGAWWVLIGEETEVFRGSFNDCIKWVTDRVKEIERGL